MLSKKVTIRLITEMDAMPIAMLVQLATQFTSRIYLEWNDRKVNAKSIMGMMSLGANTGDTITVCVEGEDEVAAMREIIAYLTSGRA
ncbi:MAG: HPr family phosphocarrier protein [Lachnospiraceae bacterium]